MNEGYRKIMVAVLTTQIKDYINGVPSIKAKASNYIFDDSKEALNYIFGFVSICKHIGLDPGRFRDKLKQIKQKGR